jgi:CRISPR system Cascade subunit CasE
MYYSNLLISTGDNPDRPRPGRLWLRDAYAVHQRLCMAFPDDARKSDDPQFLKPYNPGDFHGAAGIRGQRSSTVGMLYRIDPQPGNRVMISVLSALKPDWDYAFQNAGMLLACKPQLRDFNPQYAAGERYRFRILMNLSVRQEKPKLDANHQPILDESGQPVIKSRRFPLTWEKDSNPLDVIRPWFERKAQVRLSADSDPVPGFSLLDLQLTKLGWVQGYKPVQDKEKCTASNNFKPERKRLRFRSALLEGVLTVEEPQAFLQLVTGGIGAAKAFGFGLLSHARM